MRHTVLAQVTAADVFGDESPAELDALEAQLAPLVERVPDDDAPQAARILAALTVPQLEAGERVDWLEPYERLGLDGRWLRLIERLRMPEDPEHFRVIELASAGVDGGWVERKGVMKRVKMAPPPSHHVLTLPLTFVVSRPPKATSPSRRASKRAAVPPGGAGLRPVRPFGTNESDARVIDGLVKHVSPRVRDLPGGAARLRAQPILSVLCAVAATVWAGVRATSSSRGAHRFAKAHFYAVLDALALDEHRRALERVLLRDDHEHISIDTSAAPVHFTHERWPGTLGLFRRDRDSIVLARRADELRQQPVVLRSLLAAGPW
jgi:hypothetical protein